MESALFALFGTVTGGILSYLLNRQRFKQELKLLNQENKTEFMAETTARNFLSHKGYTDRSFKLLQKRLGGFEEDELRKILVRAGAIRIFRKDGSEWWRLVSRTDEYIARKKAKQNERNTK